MSDIRQQLQNLRAGDHAADALLCHGAPADLWVDDRLQAELLARHLPVELVVEALCALLPPDLLFLISDRGVHFKAHVFRELMRSEEFIHVLIARHRPQSNGIAERFVRSLKEWLATQSWNNDDELAALLVEFIAHYNDRPHQGLAIPGLSPNEFAKRIWPM